MLDALLDELADKPPSGIERRLEKGGTEVIEPPSGLPSVRHVFSCGEPLLPSLCQRFHGANSGFGIQSGVQSSCPESGVGHDDGCDSSVVTLCNLYGPTEADMTAWIVPPRGSSQLAQLVSVPIGRPIDDCEVLLVDPSVEGELQPVKPGEVGEICFDSVGTTRGYLNLPELTSKVVLPSSKGVGRRVFRTGDLGKWSPGDNTLLEFSGRKDRQIKLRGIRIELGGIESALISCDGVKEAYVKLDGDGATARLVAYFSPDSVTVAAVETHLRAHVPLAQVPSVFVRLPNLPRNINGKVDKGALPPPSGSRHALDLSEGIASVLLPRTKLEIEVEEIWASVLKAKAGSLDIKTDFEAIGGNSLLAGKATGLLRRAFPRKRIEGTAMYRHSTIEKLALYLEGQHAADGKEKVGFGVPLQLPGPTTTASTEYRGYDASGAIALAWQTLVLVLMHIPILLDEVLELFLYRFGFRMMRLVFGVRRSALDPPYLALLIHPVSVFIILSFCLLVKFIAFPFGIKEGRYKLWGWTHMRYWAVSKVFGLLAKNNGDIFAGTPLAPLILRLCGCSVGAGVNIRGKVHVLGPASDLITIGEHAILHHESTVSPDAIERGELIISRVSVGDHAELGLRANLAPGSSLGHHMRLQGNCSCDARAFPGGITPREPSKPISCVQNILRLGIGLPFVISIQGILLIGSVALVDVALVPLYAAGGVVAPAESIFGELRVHRRRTMVLTPIVVSMLVAAAFIYSYVFTFASSEGLYLFVVLLKALILG